jgi:hypothetical protein
MANQQSDESFAVVRIDDANVEATRVARVIADPLGIAVADLAQAISERSGILAENLTDSIASRCVVLLNAAGIAARVVPQSAIVQPPEILTLRSGRPDNDVFFYAASNRKGVVKWTDALWINLVSVQEPSSEEFDDWEVVEAGEGTRVRRFKNRRFVTKRSTFLDLVSREPWLLLRIPENGFQFAAAALPNFPTRRENLIALAAVMAAHATDARLGPGLEWVDSHTKPSAHRVASAAIYDGFLRWQLTRLFLT